MFPGLILDNQGYKVSTAENKDCADALADMNLRWAYISEGTFSHDDAQSLIFRY